MAALTVAIQFLWEFMALILWIVGVIFVEFVFARCVSDHSHVTERYVVSSYAGLFLGLAYQLEELVLTGLLSVDGNQRMQRK